MKALSYHGPGRRTWGDVPDPVVREPEDAVVRVDAVTICGTDLHILEGDVPEVEQGRVLGHEAVGAEATPEAVRELGRDGLGVDVAVEAVGVPESFEPCTRLVRPGGRVANVGVHGKPAVLRLEDLSIRDVTVTTGLVDTDGTPLLLDLLAAGRLDVAGLVTHRFGLDELQDAYDVFADAADTGALKVTLFRT
ncbi:zinc-binding dehydrogenase [Kitasatospora sp. NPDC001683]